MQYDRRMLMIAGLAIALVLGVAVVISPISALGLAASLAFVSLANKLGEKCLYACVTLVAITLPSWVPTGFVIGPISMQLYEPFLLGAALLLPTITINRSVLRFSLAVISAVLLLGCLSGYIGGNPPARIIGDIRLHLPLVVAAVVAAKVVDTPLFPKCVQVLKWTLWFSAGMIVASSFGLIALNGREEDAVQGEGVQSAVRILTASNFPAVITIFVVLAAVIGGRTTCRSQVGLLAPALIIVILAFSRNHILGLAVALSIALVGYRSWRASGRFVAIGTFVLLTVVAVNFSGPTLLSTTPGANWVSQQISSYSVRVVDGLQAESRARDLSAQYRVDENQKINVAIDQEPILGYGFGFAYKAPGGARGEFYQNQAPYYAHNYYLWLAVKTGYLGLAAFLSATLCLIVAAIWKPVRAVVPAAAALGAAMAISFVAPFPLGTPTSVLFGALIGALAVQLVNRRSRRNDEQESSPVSDSSSVEARAVQPEASSRQRQAVSGS